MINNFENEYYFLNNYFEVPVTVEGITYKNSESAFQAQKTSNISERKNFADLDPDSAKALGYKVNLRSDWEEVKVQKMYEVNKAKFEQNPELKEKLIATGLEELVEGNDWGDRFWGVDGTGENRLGKILMKIRMELSGKFDPDYILGELVEWVQDYFKKNASPETKAVVGISGGKDSSVASAVCVKALGKDRVIGVLMPQGEQADIDCSKLLVETLGIQHYIINIGDTVRTLKDEISSHIELTNQAVVNTPARIRMTTLYAVAACVGGRVVNTCNLSEDWVGYSTKFGDAAGDFSPLSSLTVTEILQIGEKLGLPEKLVHKVPIDGLCGKTDEENLGFTYAELDRYIRGLTDLSEKPELKEKIDRMNRNNKHKLELMPKFTF